MAQAQNQELTNRFLEFYNKYYRTEITELERKYPTEQRSLYIDYEYLDEFDSDLSHDYLNHPDQLREYAEEALRLSDIPNDAKLGMAHVRLFNPPEVRDVADVRVRDDLIGKFVSISGYVEKATGVDPRMTEATFECQRCGTRTYIPQSGGDFQEPHECQGCERQGPFRVNFDQSEFIDAQTLTLSPLPESGSTSSDKTTVKLEDDITGNVDTGDRVCINGILHVEQRPGKSSFDTYLNGVSISRLDGVQAEFWAEKYLDDPYSETIDGEALEAFASRSRAILTTQTLDEFGTQSKIISPFIHLLGWNVYHPEVMLEYSSNSLSSGDRADYALLDEESNPSIIVEAKQEGESLDRHTGQLKRYMRIFGAELGILSNGERFLFLCSDPNSDSPQELTVLDCGLTNLAAHTAILEAYTRNKRSNEDARKSLFELAEDSTSLE